MLKVYHPDKLHEISRCQLLREARLHATLFHPNIVQLYAAFQQVGQTSWLGVWKIRTRVIIIIHIIMQSTNILLIN